MPSAEKNTNRLYRQKYFVDAQQVLRYRPPSASLKDSRSSPAIISGRNVRLSNVKVPMNKPAPPEDAPINVRVIRKNQQVSKIIIDCPCGRHAELDIDNLQGSGGQGAAP